MNIHWDTKVQAKEWYPRSQIKGVKSKEWNLCTQAVSFGFAMQAAEVKVDEGLVAYSVFPDTDQENQAFFMSPPKHIERKITRISHFQTKNPTFCKTLHAGGKGKEGEKLS